ncbi:Fur family transcriptional regulator [Desulfovibrio inopinatus]|uniref:Fur family transcriptional regulator n=1 Tax=Desulfovibrio inopinatus TaxID=102109 RepID=UPI0004049512|nr:transcriptional repressor [Desulfovibrio inopinatus]
MMNQYDQTALAERKIKSCRKTCELHGLRLTHQRMVILEEIVKAEDHPSADVVYRRVREKIPTISLDTVYRTLATFCDLGLICKVSSTDDSARYEPMLFPHHHIICKKCGDIRDIEWSQFDDLNFPEEAVKWGRITGSAAVLRGICRQCLIDSDQTAPL